MATPVIAPRERGFFRDVLDIFLCDWFLYRLYRGGEWWRIEEQMFNARKCYIVRSWIRGEEPGVDNITCKIIGHEQY